MKQLENRTKDNRLEMDIMSALDEMQSLKARHERVDTDAALAALRRSAEEDEAAGQVELDEEDEVVLRRMLEQVCTQHVVICRGGADLMSLQVLQVRTWSSSESVMFVTALSTTARMTLSFLHSPHAVIVDLCFQLAPYPFSCSISAHAV